MPTLTSAPGPAVAVPPMAGGPAGVVPPPSVPLTFLAAAGVALPALGLAVALAGSDAVADPRDPGVVAAVHVAVLAFLTTAVLGALHQFGPVAGRRPLRSVLAARLTAGAMVGAAWLLPTGFAHGPESLVLAGGVLGAVAVTLAAWNLSGPLAGRDGGVPVAGLRLSVAYLLVTVAFGVVYAADRQTGWFPLFGNRVLAHAHLGLLGWLGLTYVAVAEKLWPMFLLAHRPSARSGALAVGLLAAGAAPLATGLLLELPPVAWAGGALVVAGLGAHLTSLAGCVRHRRRPLELLHVALFSSAAFLVVGVVLGFLAAVADLDPEVRARLVAAEVAAALGWLGVAIVGHVHKIVPFIGYAALRARGVRFGPTGKPLVFGDLYHRGAARLSVGGTTAAFGLVVVGLLASSPATVSAGGVLLAVAGAVVSLNLAVRPRRVARLARKAS